MVETGSKPSMANRYYNVTNPFFLLGSDKQHIIDILPLPGLHLLLRSSGTIFHLPRRRYLKKMIQLTILLKCEPVNTMVIPLVEINAHG